MPDTSLPWRILGRLVRPYAFAVSLATGIIAYACAASVAVGQLLDGPPGQNAATAATNDQVARPPSHSPSFCPYVRFP